jgi:tetratricopeptide (TPR) repeat protein
MKSYEQAVFIKQDYYEAWYALGNVQFTLQRNPNAIASYDKALFYAPNYKPVGWALPTLRYPNAIASYDKALFYAPNYKPARDAKKQAEKELEKK